jgi:hypothetical protein
MQFGTPAEGGIAHGDKARDASAILCSTAE